MMPAARKVTTEERLDQLEKRVAALERLLAEQPKFVPCDSDGRQISGVKCKA